MKNYHEKTEIYSWSYFLPKNSTQVTEFNDIL